MFPVLHQYIYTGRHKLSYKHKNQYITKNDSYNNVLRNKENITCIHQNVNVTKKYTMFGKQEGTRRKTL